VVHLGRLRVRGRGQGDGEKKGEAERDHGARLTIDPAAIAAVPWYGVKRR
jgi:hypothetical protein